MIKKIDWYIIRSFLVTFFFCIILFAVVSVAVDSSEKTDDFVRSGLSTIELIKQYYIGFIPHLIGLLFPVFVFIAVIFFTSRLATRSEIIAILASGTSYSRFLLPYLIGGIFLALVLFFASRTVIPRANEIRSDFQIKYVDSHDGSKNQLATHCNNCYYRRIDSNTYIGIKNYDTTNKSSGQFFMDKLKGNRVVYNLRAEMMQWDTSKMQWKLQNVTERVVDSTGEIVKEFPSMHVKLGIQPNELKKDYYLKDKLTTPELKLFIKQEELRGTEGLNTFKMEQYRRSATPFSVIILTLIGAIIASRKTRGGSGLHLAMGIIIASIFVLSDRFSTVFATKANFPPIIAAWLPNIVFLFVGYYLYRRAPK